MVLEAACDSDFSCFLHLADYDFLYTRPRKKIFILWPIPFKLRCRFRFICQIHGPVNRLHSYKSFKPSLEILWLIWNIFSLQSEMRNPIYSGGVFRGYTHQVIDLEDWHESESQSSNKRSDIGREVWLDCCRHHRESELRTFQPPHRSMGWQGLSCGPCQLYRHCPHPLISLHSTLGSSDFDIFLEIQYSSFVFGLALKS